MTDVWGPIYWAYLRTYVSTVTDESATNAATGMSPLVTAFTASLPCESCKLNFAKVLAKYPPSTYAQTLAKRLEWYDLVRQEVRQHEPPKSMLTRLRRSGPLIFKTLGFVLLLLIAAFMGALVLRRCQEKGVM